MVQNRRFVTTLTLVLIISIGVFAQTTVAVFNGASPVLFTNEDGEADGFFPQLLREIIPDHELLFITGLTFDEAYQKVKSGEIDIIPALIKTPEREAHFTFNQETVVVSWSELLIEPSSSISGLLDLRGTRPVVLFHREIIAVLILKFNIQLLKLI